MSLRARAQLMAESSAAVVSRFGNSSTGPPAGFGNIVTPDGMSTQRRKNTWRQHFIAVTSGAYIARKFERIYLSQ